MGKLRGNPPALRWRLARLREIALLACCFLSMPLHGQSANTPLILPEGVAFDTAGNLYFAETGRHVVRRLTPAGVLSVVAGTGTQGFGGDGGPAANALLDSPVAVALDAAANLFIADTHNHRIRRVDGATGIISTFAQAALPAALAFDPAGNLAYADAATHRVTRVAASNGQATVLAGNGTQGYAGDGGLATAASLDTPSGLAFDAASNLYLTDAHNHRVRRVDAATGIVTTIAGTGTPGFSGDGFAANGAQLSLPHGVSLDAAGNLYLADMRNQRIRRIDAATGTVTTIAGDGTQGFAGDGAAATGAALNSPRSVAISPGGLATVADTGNNRVRQVDAIGDLQTIAGIGAISPAGAVSSTALAQTSQQTLTATVTGASGTATGSVSLIDGTTPIASAPLAGGTVGFSTSILSTGSHTLTAAYGGLRRQLDVSDVNVPAADCDDRWQCGGGLQPDGCGWVGGFAFGYGWVG
jgi:sugar lactone lactonase YvrE